MSELLPCPFCGAEASFLSNRDWHRVVADHTDDCCLGADDFMWPATDEGRADAVAAWNKRAPEATAPQVGSWRCPHCMGDPCVCGTRRMPAGESVRALLECITQTPDPDFCHILARKALAALAPSLRSGEKALREILALPRDFSSPEVFYHAVRDIAQAALAPAPSPAAGTLELTEEDLSLLWVTAASLDQKAVETPGGAAYFHNQAQRYRDLSRRLRRALTSPPAPGEPQDD